MCMNLLSFNGGLIASIAPRGGLFVICFVVIGSKMKEIINLLSTHCVVSFLYPLQVRVGRLSPPTP